MNDERPDWASWAGLVVWSGIAAVLTLLQVFLLPLSTSTGTHIPVAIVLAIVANLLLPRLFVKALGLRWGWIAPAVVWFAIVLASASVTSDGDLLISGDKYAGTWSTVFLVAGSLSLVAGAALANFDLSRLAWWRRED